MNMVPMSLHRGADRDGQAYRRRPMFSVIVPLFNKQATVRRTLASVLAQDWTDFEVIVIDDGSTDCSAAEAAKVIDGRIRRLQQPNAGPAAARNSAATEALGEWLAFMDADDLWTPDHLSTLAGLIRALPDADLACTRSRQMREADLVRPPQSGADRSIGEVDYLSEARRFSLQTSCVAVRRSAFDALGGFGPYCPGEDTELWARFALVKKFAVSNAETSIYVRGTWGIMERLERTRSRPAQPGVSPIQATLVRCLRHPGYSERHARIRAHLDQLYLRDARISLVRGYPGIARQHLSSLTATTPLALFYKALSFAPPRVLMTAIRCSSIIRRRLKLMSLGKDLSPAASTHRNKKELGGTAGVSTPYLHPRGQSSTGRPAPPNVEALAG